MSYAHPHDHISELMKNEASFVLTKRSWDGFSSQRGEHQFSVLSAGPEWIWIEHIHNGSTAYKKPRRFWITWKDFGSFSVEVQ